MTYLIEVLKARFFSHGNTYTFEYRARSPLVSWHSEDHPGHRGTGWACRSSHRDVRPAGTYISAHRHRDEDEGIYVAEGEATFACGETVMSATAGTLLFLPQHVHQHLEVGKSAPFRYLTWMTATGFAHHVLHIGEPGQALELSPPPFASQERIQQLALLLRNATTPSLADF